MSLQRIPSTKHLPTLPDPHLAVVLVHITLHRSDGTILLHTIDAYTAADILSTLYREMTLVVSTQVRKATLARAVGTDGASRGRLRKCAGCAWGSLPRTGWCEDVRWTRVDTTRVR